MADLISIVASLEGFGIAGLLLVACALLIRAWHNERAETQRERERTIELYQVMADDARTNGAQMAEMAQQLNRAIDYISTAPRGAK